MVLTTQTRAERKGRSGGLGAGGRKAWYSRSQLEPRTEPTVAWGGEGSSDRAAGCWAQARGQGLAFRGCQEPPPPPVAKSPPNEHAS